MKILNIFKSVYLAESYHDDIAKLINQKLPKVRNGFTRLWRGNRPGEVGKNPSYTSSLEGIALPFYYGYYDNEDQPAILSYVDIPTQVVQKHITSGADDTEFILPKELLKNVKVVDRSIYKDYEDKNFAQSGIKKGGLSSFDDFADNFMRGTV